MAINISDHFTLGRLLRFTAPTAAMMIFTSIYGVVDGLFVSNFVGKESFAALNLIYPLLMMLGALGFMFGTGGTALVAKTMGEGDDKRARGLFSLVIYVTLGVGIACGVACLVIVRPVGIAFGATGTLLEECVVYGGILAFSLPFLMLQEAFQSFLTAAGKPKVGLAIIVAAGVTNIALDALFIVGFGWGLAGAAAATAASEFVGGGIPLIYFACKNESSLRLGRPVADLRALGRVCANGSSELVSNISMSLVSMLYNYQLMAYIGADGVAVYGIIQYAAWIFVSLFMGFAVGVSPIVSYNYGAKNSAELKGLFRKSLGVMATGGVLITVFTQLLAHPLAALFVGYDAALTDMTVGALREYSLAFIFVGVSVFGSSFFTALNNGLVSALIAFLRTLVFECGAVLLLPLVLGTDGIWLAIVVAEIASVVLTSCFLVGLRKQYGYA